MDHCVCVLLISSYHSSGSSKEADSETRLGGDPRKHSEGLRRWHSMWRDCSKQWCSVPLSTLCKTQENILVLQNGPWSLPSSSWGNWYSLNAVILQWWKVPLTCSLTCLLAEESLFSNDSFKKGIWNSCLLVTSCAGQVGVWVTVSTVWATQVFSSLLIVLFIHVSFF